MANTKISALTGASTPLAGTEVLPIVQSSATVKVAVSDLTAGRSVSMKDLTITGTGYVVTITAASTTRKAGSIGNTGGTVDWGVESSAGGSLFTYAGAYTGNIGTSGATDFNICANGNVVATAKTGGDFSLRAGNIIPATAAKGINFTANTPAAGKTSQLLNWYEEGTWTPTDASGASLAFTNTSGNCYYTRNGNVVTCIFNVTYPATADVNSARITGLPFTSKSTTNAVAGGQLAFTNYGTFVSMAVDTGGNSFYFWTAAGGLITNATCSGKVFRGVITYMI